ncbi:hypothetical protein [Streptomyces sp. NPDC005244]|uniref:hypothetical protein n=1 Tax=Streptomyces sp. NPDC005244 TaxID=3364708 RepID=UPI0036CCFC38
MTLHWSVVPPADCDDKPEVLEYRAAEYERRQAEDEFIATEPGTLEAWHLANYMESAFQAEGVLYYAARDVYEKDTP